MSSSKPSNFRDVLEKKSKVITLSVFVADVIILIAVLIVLWAMPDPKTPGEDCGYMCLKCTTDVSGMCCGCRDKILQDYMEQTFDQKYHVVALEYKNMFENGRPVKVHNGSIGDVKPVAHLIGEDRDKPSKDAIAKEEILPVKKWYRGHNCLLLNGISLHRGRFRVPVDGFYHVYSVIDFNYQYKRDRENNTIDVQSKHSCMKHAIFKSNIKDAKRQEEIICTHHPYEMSQNLIFARYDTYVSGDVYLKAGDEIYVKVANISFASSPPKNVFGIHMI